MKDEALFDKIDLHLIKVLHMVLTERSVSRAALRLGMNQPAVSAALRRLRDLAQDPLLVRSGTGMAPTDAGLAMIEPSARLLREAADLFQTVRFDPQRAAHTFRIAASDYLDPLFLPSLVSSVKREAPLCRIELQTLSAASDYRPRLASGELDLVIGNWTAPPPDLHLGQLVSDEVVCLLRRDHPALRRGWDVTAWLESEHVAPTPTHPGARGVIDEHLDSLGLRRNIAVRATHFSQIPDMVADSLLVLTTGRQFCERFVDRLPVVIVPSPVAFPPMNYYQLWHARAQSSQSGRWLRERVKQLALMLKKNKPISH